MSEVLDKLWTCTLSDGELTDLMASILVEQERIEAKYDIATAEAKEFKEEINGLENEFNQAFSKFALDCIHKIRVLCRPSTCGHTECEAHMDCNSGKCPRLKDLE